MRPLGATRERGCTADLQDTMDPGGRTPPEKGDAVLFFPGAVLAGLGVALGAIGAHSLHGRLTPPQLETFRTGVQYQLIHVVPIGGVAFILAWLALAVAALRDLR